jgi:hypothetical protein
MLFVLFYYIIPASYSIIVCSLTFPPFPALFPSPFPTLFPSESDAPKPSVRLTLKSYANFASDYVGMPLWRVGT